MPRSVFDFDGRRANTSVSTWIVSPWNSGAGKVTFSNPRFVSYIIFTTDEANRSFVWMSRIVQVLVTPIPLLTASPGHK